MKCSICVLDLFFLFVAFLHSSSFAYKREYPFGWWFESKLTSQVLDRNLRNRKSVEAFKFQLRTFKTHLRAKDANLLDLKQFDEARRSSMNSRRLSDDSTVESLNDLKWSLRHLETSLGQEDASAERSRWSFGCNSLPERPVDSHSSSGFPYSNSYWVASWFTAYSAEVSYRSRPWEQFPVPAFKLTHRASALIS